MKKSIILLVGLILILSLSSCKEETPLPQDTFTTGNVKLFDDGKVPADNKGMIVSVEDSTLDIYGITDETGKFELKNLPKGTFNLIYEKEGYGTYKLFSIENTGDGKIKETPLLGKKASTEIHSVILEQTEDTLYFYVSTNSSPGTNNEKYVRIFLMEKKDAKSELNYLNSKWHSDLLTITSSGTPILRLDKEDLLNLGFSSGSTVLYIAYGDSYYSNDYTDPSTGKRIFPNLNTYQSPTLSFVVP